jgi:hypothetical protein
MSKKKRLEKKKSKQKSVKYKSGVEERVKAIQSIQIPDEEPYKKENESSLERFMRFGLKRVYAAKPIKKAKREEAVKRGQTRKSRGRSSQH